MRALTYHYVRPGTDRPPYEYYYLDLDDFRRQLDHLDDAYDLIDRQHFLDCVAGDRSPPDDAVVLTFDDGLIDHYEYVLPELQTRGLWGLFFVPGPIGDDALAVHRVHTLLGTTPAAAVAEALAEVVDPADVREGRREQFEQMYESSSSGEAVTRIKRTLNYLLPYDRVPEVLTALEERFPGGGVDPSDLYMSPEEVGALVDAGMVVGGHTVTHRVLSRLSAAEQRSEIERSLAYIDRAAGDQPIRSFAYPYGTAETFDGDTLAGLREGGCDIAFTTESAPITARTLTETPLRVPRQDCNEFPHGEASRY
jgi:peptidoglycan/xylan/chitin deacetylase (PgdA/CDA1 family)